MKDIEFKESDTKVYVIGHKNPDTDSVCSAICYARLKNKIADGRSYVAKRAGHLNEETQFVFKKAGIEPPEYIKDVRPQVCDIEIKKINGVSEKLSVRNAWRLMKELNVVTLPITDDKRLKGLVTIGDIAKSYFEMFDDKALASAGTNYGSIAETLEGNIEREAVSDAENNISDNADAIAYEDRVCEGKVVIATANPEAMENFIEKGDIVILGNRYESQLCAIEMEAGCIILCDGAKASHTIKKLAKENNCIIICTGYDTYAVARLINQAMPISCLMKEREGLVTFKTKDFIEDIQEIMAKKRHRDFPIEDEDGNFVGMISRRNLLKSGRKKIILVDHNEKSQAVHGVETAEILEIIDHHRLGTIETISPVFFRNQPLGCTATIIYKMYKESGQEIDKETALLLCSAIISDTLIFKSPTCTKEDIDACMEMSVTAGIDPVEFGKEMFRAGSNLSDKTEEEIFYRDFKKFSVNDITIGVGQVNSMGEEEIDAIKGRMNEYIKKMENNSVLDTAYLLMTNVMTESSYVLYAGKNASSILSMAFNMDVNEDCVLLKGVVSRKKQFLPAIMEALQQ